MQEQLQRRESAEEGKPPRVVIVGIDGAEPTLIERWVQEGHLPHLRQLREEGAYGLLRSTPNIISASAWTSFMTGLNPGKHGISHFVQRVSGDYHLQQINATYRHGATLWQLLGRGGKRVAVLNLPLTFPVEQVNGVQVAGWLAPSLTSPGATYPPSLAEELLHHCGGYVMTPDVRRYAVGGDYQRGLQNAQKSLAWKCQAAHYVFDQERWDLFTVVLVETDTIQHYYWHLMDPSHPQYEPQLAAKYGGAIRQIYQQVDRFLGELIAKCDEHTTFVVLSDHGFGPNHLGNKYLRHFMELLGLQANREDQKAPLWRRPLQGVRRRGRKAAVSLYDWVHKYVPKKLRLSLSARFPQLRSHLLSVRQMSGVDWSRTRAFASTHHHPWINLKGREAQGQVEPGPEYDRLREFIIQKLYEATDPATGQPVVERVYKKEEVYSGPFLDLLPDLSIQWKEGRVITGMTVRDEKGTLQVARPERQDPRTGNHYLNGIMILSGHHIARVEGREQARIEDLAPTVLHLLGEAVPSEMDGQVLTPLLTEDFRANHPVRYQRESSPEDRSQWDLEGPDQEEIEERLRGLGYL